MALKQRYEKREEIPNELAGHYIEREGGWHLEAERDQRLEEFRANNVTLLKENRELKERYAGFDPEAHRALAAEKQRLEEEQRIKEGKVGEVIAEKVKAAVGPVAAERDAANARLSALLIDNAVVAEATKLGLRPTAIPDLTARARQAFKLVEGNPRAFEADGQTPRVGKDGAAPMTLAEWVEALGTDAPHLFAANAGGGAAGSGSGGAGMVSGSGNPYRKDTFNLTEQMKLEKRDPQLAARLQAAA